MSNTTDRQRHAAERRLCEITSLPTAAGHEHRVIRAVEKWAARHKAIRLRRDRVGNLILSLEQAPTRPDPLIIEAHLDHPAFVVTRVHHRNSDSEPATLEAEFRGGVDDAYFHNATIRLWPDDVTDHDTDDHNSDNTVTARITELRQPRNPLDFKTVTATLDQPGQATAHRIQPGDFATWHLPPARIIQPDPSFHPRGVNPQDPRLLLTRVTDNLASVAAALTALERLARSRKPLNTDVRLLLSRGEEIGFLGALAACKHKSIPKRSRVLVLENSKSFDDSPIGGGVIVRVGDRATTFDPGLTERLVDLCQSLATKSNGRAKPTGDFRWQRKLMPGGVCNATAYAQFGFRAACLCLPLGRYHNMNEATGSIDSEVISPADYHAMTDLLVEAAHRFDEPPNRQRPTLKQRLEARYERHRHVLD